MAEKGGHWVKSAGGGMSFVAAGSAGGGADGLAALDAISWPTDSKDPQYNKKLAAARRQEARLLARPDVRDAVRARNNWGAKTFMTWAQVREHNIRVQAESGIGGMWGAARGSGVGDK